MAQSSESRTDAAAAGATEAEQLGFSGGKRIWVGEHSGDGDLLVFDPAEADGEAEHLSFFSLSQLRNRVFPRRVVAQHIREVTDKLRAARAKKDYDRRTELAAAQETEQETAREARMDRLRHAVLDLHRLYMERQEIAYKGVYDTPEGHRPRRRSRCHWCGIGLDDFAGSVCVACEDVLCSCGACACGSRLKSR